MSSRMSHSGGSAAPETKASVTVAVAVRGDPDGGGGGKGSRRAVTWAVENFMHRADRFVLVHVMPKIASIPTPSGDRIPVTELDTNVVAMYVQDMKEKLEEVFIPFKKLCKARQMESVVLEDNDPAAALLRYASDSQINTLVLGSSSSNCITRKLKGPGVPTKVLSCASNTCDIFVVSKQRTIPKAACPSYVSDTSSAQCNVTQGDHREGSSIFREQVSRLHSFPLESQVRKTFGATTISDLSFLNSESFTQIGSRTSSIVDLQRNLRSFGDDLESLTSKQCNSLVSFKTEQLDAEVEVEHLRQELQSTIALYKRTCEELVHAQRKVQLLSSECLEEARNINDALQREETFRKVAEKERSKHLEALKEVENAKLLLAKEAYERQIAELNAIKESSEKKKIVDTLFSSDCRYKRYTSNEIEVATNFFSETNVIGEGGYGKVYKCSLDHTPVAVKVLQSNATSKKEEFLKEVEVLGQLHHPNIVLLLGACPESGCLVYEYLENGSLEDYILHRNGRPSLPWFMRFRIVFQIACGLAFLHNSKPEPIVHRDIKPANILLDRNYVSKIGDVGLAKLISDVVPDNITEYRDSIIAGTLFYIDPEYQRTGTIRPKSDLYAFGIIILQLLTARHPNGLLLTVEKAIANGSFADILDKSVVDWPLVETEELARVALKCSKLRCRERPDLEAELLPVLKRLVDIANASVKVESNNVYAPSHYYCPILQEIMDDPHIAADGFTYEYEAIKAWLEKHKVSPSTKLELEHTILTPNHTLRSAIHDWRSRVTLSST